MTKTSECLTDAKRALCDAAPTDAAVAAIADVELLDSIALLEELSRLLDVAKVRYSSEVGRRSRPELGHQGLAARHGHLNAASLLRSLTRSSFREATRRIRVGDILAESAAARALGDESPFDEIATAVFEGRLGVEGADGVVRALTPVVEIVEPALLREATAILATEGSVRNADDLGTMARGARDTLDRLGVKDRERFLREQRSLRRGPVIDGLRRVTLVLDPETDAIIMGAIDHAMSPRLGGPRFVDAAEQDRAKRLIDDDRTNEQLAIDILADLVRIGVDRDEGTILGQVKPALRVTISFDDLMRAVDKNGREHPETDTGVAWLEGCTEPLSAATARRILCEQGALPIILDGAGEPLDLGRPRRLFSHAQRTALANRDGGCRFSDCDRPPSWCEAHHIDPHGMGGPTNIDNGMLLCRRHHLILHDHGWRIERVTEPWSFVLIPPKSVDSDQVPRLMPSKLPRWLRAG